MSMENVHGILQNAQPFAPPVGEPCIVDVIPTWGEIGDICTRLAESREVETIRGMCSEIARAMAAAQALKAITGTLSEGSPPSLPRR